jgi:hypothetical protein
LDPATGAALREEICSCPLAGQSEPVSSAHSIDGLLNDIPGTDGEDVFIRQMKFFAEDGRSRPHLYSTAGYLDSSWFNRTFWKIGRAQTSGLMVLGDDVAYGVEVYASRSRETVFKPGSNPYRLMCLPLRGETEGRGKANAKTKPLDRKKRKGGVKPIWQQHVGIRVGAMVRAGDTILVAGSPDVVDPDDPHGAWEGRMGGILAAFAAANGEKLAERRLPAPPVWDGMAVAYGRVYVSLLDGSVICLKAAN